MNKRNTAIAIGAFFALTTANVGFAEEKPAASRYTLIPTDKQLKKIYDDFVAFRADSALRRLAPIVTARAKKGFKTPEDRLRMARLMELVALSYQIDDNYTASLNALIIANKICPQDAHVQCMLANMYRDFPDFVAEDRLIAELDKLPESERFPYYYNTMARHARRDGDLAMAMKLLEKCDRLDVEKKQVASQVYYGRTLLLTGLNKAAVDSFKAAAAHTENKYLREILLGNAAQIEFDDAAQEEHLSAAGRIYPDDPIWRLKLAEFYLQRGKDKQALPLLEEAVHCKRFMCSAYYKLARYYMSKGKHDKALNAVQYLERITRTTPDTLALKGEIEAGRNNKTLAEKYYKQALSLNRKNWGLYELIVEFYKSIPNRAQDAVSVSNDFVKFLPGFWPAYYCSAQANLTAKQLAPAEKAAAKALEQLSVYPQKDLNLYALHRAGVAHAIIGTKLFVEDKDAERAFEEAKAFNEMKFKPDLPIYLKMVSLRPEKLKFNAALGIKDPMRHVALADMLLECNYVTQSVAEYKKAQALAPSDQTVRSYLIHALSQKGDWGGAACENFAFSQTLVNQIPAAIDEFRGGKKKKKESKTEKSSGVKPDEVQEVAPERKDSSEIKSEQLESDGSETKPESVVGKNRTDSNK